MSDLRDLIFEVRDGIIAELMSDGSFAKRLHELYKEQSTFTEATSIKDKRSLAARMRALQYDWRNYLIHNLTRIAIYQKPRSRRSIAMLQKALFGKSQSSQSLTSFLDSSNKHPKKIFISIEPDLSRIIIQTYLDFSPALDKLKQQTFIEEELQKLRSGIVF